MAQERSSPTRCSSRAERTSEKRPATTFWSMSIGCWCMRRLRIVRIATSTKAYSRRGLMVTDSEWLMSSIRRILEGLLKEHGDQIYDKHRLSYTYDDDDTPD